MTIDIKWMVENLATKDDVKRIETALDGQRVATAAVRDTLTVEIAQRLAATEQRLTDVEAYQRTQQEERRDHTRRAEDRRRQRVTWAIALLAPLLVVVAWGWQGVVAVLRAVHVVGGK